MEIWMLKVLCGTINAAKEPLFIFKSVVEGADSNFTILFKRNRPFLRNAEKYKTCITFFWFMLFVQGQCVLAELELTQGFFSAQSPCPQLLNNLYFVRWKGMLDLSLKWGGKLTGAGVQ